MLALIFLGHLTYFHLWLQKHGMTTYEYIRWKANITRQSKIKRRKSDKAREAAEAAAAAAAANGVNITFMGSN